jgi:hypothetical protein
MSERLASYFTAASMELVFSLSFAALIFPPLFYQEKRGPPAERMKNIFNVILNKS